MSMSKQQLAHALASHFEDIADTSKKPKTSKSSKTDRLLVEIGKYRMPMKQLLDRREIRDAMSQLELYRQKFNEQEFMFGARVYLSYGQGECWAILKRPETDKEYQARQDYLAEQQRKKAERARLKQLREYEAEQRRITEAAARAAEEQRLELERAREIAARHGYRLVDN